MGINYYFVSRGGNLFGPRPIWKLDEGSNRQLLCNTCEQVLHSYLLSRFSFSFGLSFLKLNIFLVHLLLSSRQSMCFSIRI